MTTRAKVLLLATPDAGSLSEVVLIDEPCNKGIVSDNARVRMFNASFNAAGYDVYLTAPGVDLATVQPTFAAVGYKQAVPASGADKAELEGGAYSLRITASGRTRPDDNRPGRAAQIDIRARTPSVSMSLPRPRITISPRSISRYWSASSAAKS